MSAYSLGALSSLSQPLSDPVRRVAMVLTVEETEPAPRALTAGTRLRPGQPAGPNAVPDTLSPTCGFPNPSDSRRHFQEATWEGVSRKGRR